MPAFYAVLAAFPEQFTFGCKLLFTMHFLYFEYTLMAQQIGKLRVISDTILVLVMYMKGS